MSKILTQQTALKAVSKRLGRRFKNCDGKGIFQKMDFFGKCLAKSTGQGFESEMVPGPKIQY